MNDDKKKKDGEISHTRSVEHTIVTSLDDFVEGESEKQAYILFLTGPLVGKMHMLAQGKTSIGRSRDAVLTVNDNRISRLHVEIELNGNQVFVRDLGSTNGTYVNGKRVSELGLEDGDKIQVSSTTVFKFAWQDDTENIFHEELYKMAVVDTVTNIYNKRYLLDRLGEEFSHAKRTDLPLSLIMLDIDHFKSVNDTYGHLAGDMVLTQLARLLKEQKRAEDVLARYGGEEFGVLLRETNTEAAVALAERMRKIIDQETFVFQDQEIPVTISLGVATMTPERQFANEKELIHSADKALYESKEGGRNRVTVAKE